VGKTRDRKQSNERRPAGLAASATEPTVSIASSSRTRWHHRIVWRLVAVLVVLAGVFRGGFDLGSAYPRAEKIRGILPGEFERHDGLMLAWSENASQHAAQARIVAHAVERQRIFILVADSRARDEAIAALAKDGIAGDRVVFLETSVRLPWIRDYGPLAIKTLQSDYEWLDIECLDEGTPSHDDVPGRLVEWLQRPLVSVPLTLEGGNLLSNGARTLITTTKILDQNAVKRNYSERKVTALLREYFGARQVVYLEPLQGEPTSHVDMFVTLTAPDEAVVGSYDPAVDPANAALLDRNAERLSNVMTESGPMRVIRMPMPPRVGGRWYTYTNVVYANGVLLVPSYPKVDGEYLEQVRTTYQRLLPGWQIVPIDAEALVEAEGALHCATLNLHRVP
jgi:agmatine/peptidylarginine deiminase